MTIDTHVLTSREKVAEDTKSNQEQFKPDELFCFIPLFLLWNFSIRNANFPYFFQLHNNLWVLISEKCMNIKVFFLR